MLEQALHCPDISANLIVLRGFKACTWKTAEGVYSFQETHNGCKVMVRLL